MEGFKDVRRRGQVEGFGAEGAVPCALLQTVKRVGPRGLLQKVNRTGPGGLLQVAEGAGSGVRVQNAEGVESERWSQKAKGARPSGRGKWVGSGGWLWSTAEAGLW